MLLGFRVWGLGFVRMCRDNTNSLETRFSIYLNVRFYLYLYIYLHLHQHSSCSYIYVHVYIVCIHELYRGFPRITQTFSTRLTPARTLDSVIVVFSRQNRRKARKTTANSVLPPHLPKTPDNMAASDFVLPLERGPKPETPTIRRCVQLNCGSAWWPSVSVGLWAAWLHSLGPRFIPNLNPQTRKLNKPESYALSGNPRSLESQTPRKPPQQPWSNPLKSPTKKPRSPKPSTPNPKSGPRDCTEHDLSFAGIFVAPQIQSLQDLRPANKSRRFGLRPRRGWGFRAWVPLRPPKGWGFRGSRVHQCYHRGV